MASKKRKNKKNKTKKARERLHGGRFQAQGSMKTKGEGWSQDDPLKYKDGKDLLTNLQTKLTQPEYEERRYGFKLCHADIKSMHENGGFSYPGVWKQSYPNAKQERIDLDIFKGIAFV